jgi:glycosyltransferase involved in cell wall biosynthesis
MEFRQKRLNAFFLKGMMSYAEFNIRLFFFLLFKRADMICAIDLDTIIPCYFVSRLKSVPRVYDAHELFCEMKEVVTRPKIYRVWKRIERWFVPRFANGYTVNRMIADEFNRMYGVEYEVIKNMPLLKELSVPVKTERYILYQGAVNEGRSFETLIPAMKSVNAKLLVCGDGNFMEEARDLVKEQGLEDKVIFKGKLLPADLREYTRQAWAGVTLFDDRGLSNYYSLANRFFDYMHAGIPQVCVNYPVYNGIIGSHPFALLIDDISAENISIHLTRLLEDEALYSHLQQNALQARSVLNWQAEEKKLIAFYKKIVG